MFRRIYILALCFLVANIAAWGQQYRVCDVSSAPAHVRLASGKDVVRNIHVEGKDILEFARYSKISLMDVKSKEIFFYAGEGRFKVEDIVGKNRAQIKQNLKAHLKDLLQGKTHTKMAGVVYKDLASEVTTLHGNSLLIVNEKGNIVGQRDIEEGGIYYFVVSNTSDVPYFVNVISTGADDRKRVCCLSGDAMAQMDLLVPAEGTVMLSAFPQMGKDLMSVELKVVASEAPFDAKAYLEENPYIQILSPAHNSTSGYPYITLRFLVKDPDKIKWVDAFLNGKEDGRIAVVEGINEQKFKLASYGPNLLELRLQDMSGRKYSLNVSVNYERLDKPKLHIMAVGIGNYKNSGIEKLHYAASDAAMVAEVLDTLRAMNLDLYDKGGCHFLLADEEATRGRILKCLDDIRYEADAGDIVMVYMSGHGKYVEFTSQRYFLPYDVEDDMYIESTAISYADLKGKLKQLEDKECKVIVYMDACYAGEMYYTKAANDFIGDSEPAVIGFYSSTRNQPSLEKVELNHGVFTYALLNGIKGGASDSNGNVTITSLGDYITEQVRIESQGRQTPKVDNGGEDFILFRAGDKNMKVTVPAMKVGLSGKGDVVETEKNSVIGLAESYYTGTAVPPTMEDEFKAYIAAAELGDLKSMYMAGVCLEKGKGTPQDYGAALEWYGKAAVAGLAAAQYNLGAMHYNGTGVARSVDLAEKWFLEADGKGYAMASAALGHLYYHKDTPDYNRAFRFFSKGAEGGDAMALFYLGECHLYGRGTVEDISAALQAYKRSAEKGFQAAKDKLMEIDF